MEELLLRVGSQAANFAIRSGLGYASKFAFVQVSKFIQGAPDDATADLEKLRKRLENKIKIVTPAIDLIERIAARGNTSLASTVQLTTALRHDINEFAKKVSDATETQKTTGAKTSAATQKQNIASVLDSMKDLLRRIEDAVPLISLALTTSGANLSSSLPDNVSPSRLLQASSLLRSADDTFERTGQPVQVGPTFIVKFYSIFTSHTRVSSIKDIQWKEEYAKCCACIVRVASRAHKEGAIPHTPTAESGLSTLIDGYEYELRLMEDLDDGRYHEELEDWSRKKMKSVVAEKGFIEGRIRHIPVHKIARLFYEHAGILLNLGESLSPVLIAKVQHGAPHPQNVLEHFTKPGENSEDEFEDDFASGFESEEEEDVEAAKGAWMGDIEWIAFEVSQEEDSDDEEDESDSEDTDNADDLLPAMSALKLNSSPIPASPSLPRGVSVFQQQQSSLSLLEYLLRLAALQTFEQQSHMDLTDEHIVLFLRDDNPASRQQPTLEQERTLRRRSSQTSISSDFSTRPLHHTGGQFPISPPHSDDHHHDNSTNSISRSLTPISTPPIPTTSGKSAEKPTAAGPVGRNNPRTHLERAMAEDYDPMTLITPISNRRVTRNGVRKPTNLVLANNKRKSETGIRNSSSAPNSSHKPAPIGQISADKDINSTRNSTNSNPSPLVGKTGRFPVRRSVSAVQKRGD